MLTKSDRTVTDPIAVLDSLRADQCMNIGVKDAGIAPESLMLILKEIRERGKNAYLEVMSDRESDWLQCVQAAEYAGARAILGTRRSNTLDKLIAGTKLAYYPVIDDASAYARTLEGDSMMVEKLARRACSADHVSGTLLNPFRIACNPELLITSVKNATSKSVFVTGTIHTLERISAIQKMDVDHFAVGTAVFEGSFVNGGIAEQISAINSLLDKYKWGKNGVG